MQRRAILIMVVILVALGAYMYHARRPRPAPPSAPRLSVWSIDMDDLKRLSIHLPAVGKGQVWVRQEDHHWYFAGPDGPQVNMKRWGGAVPLLLSRPGAERHIADHATAEQLAGYGLNQPDMTIGLTLKNGRRLNIAVGDRTPDGQAYYVKRADAREIYTVHASWRDVFERLVLEPPYSEPK